MIDPIVSVPPKLPSNPKFGYFFALLFAAIAAYGYWKSWEKLAVMTSVLAVSFAFVARIAPDALKALNRLWYELGFLLGKIVSPVVLGIIFFVLISPISLISRLFGRDELKMKKQNLESYWVVRLPTGPSSESFKKQY